MKFKSLDKSVFKPFLIYNYNYEKAHMEDEFNELAKVFNRDNSISLLARVKEVQHQNSNEMVELMKGCSNGDRLLSEV